MHYIIDMLTDKSSRRFHCSSMESFAQFCKQMAESGRHVTFIRAEELDEATDEKTINELMTRI